MAVTTDLGISASIYQSKAQDLTVSEDRLSFRRAVHLASGTGAGKADKVFHDRRTLAASATEDLDLAGVLLDAFGTAITFVKVKGLFVAAAEGNTNSVIVGNATSNAWSTLLGATGTVTLRPGASFGVMAGAADATAYAVTAGTGDLLKIANSAAGTSVSYDIVIVGASA
ncbi:hypothetical protein [Streptomyces albipurpureus]|uniref:PLAT domain-containing protein n=1 Tax=Streptomyces albipurpureus TaxID=2897419 RepID=A0ABT0V0I3_9ACTN|nr:hypothetical protein [Streptomyces sp. CWNU-1]MCM2394357.1 hypothetical protein [Streptomyces sp. CWNU-1]